ncbi:hypothetical protein AAMO2058_001302000, partial [Amorphochlora amoebiformis]
SDTPALSRKPSRDTPGWSPDEVCDAEGGSRGGGVWVISVMCPRIPSRSTKAPISSW